MKLSTKVRDSLYLTWAVPAGALPELPRPLTYQVHKNGGHDLCLVSVVVSRQDKLRVPLFPVRLSYCQLNLFTYVLDGDRRPGVFLCRAMTPSWIAPGARLVTGLPMVGAAFECPEPSRDPEGGPWTWRIEGEGLLELTAERSAPKLGPGPPFPSWDALVESLRERARVWGVGIGGLHQARIEVEASAVWPLSVDVTDLSLLERWLELPEGWPPLFAAWLDAELPMVLELGEEPAVALQGVPAAG